MNPKRVDDNTVDFVTLKTRMVEESKYSIDLPIFLHIFVFFVYLDHSRFYRGPSNSCVQVNSPRYSPFFQDSVRRNLHLFSLCVHSTILSHVVFPHRQLPVSADVRMPQIVKESRRFVVALKMTEG